jgi:uncharacterized membrane protein YjfL (UPF0719 family)
MKTIIFIQVMIAFTIGVSALFLVYKLMDSLLKRRFHIEENNTAFAVFQTGILLSAALIVSSIVNPAVNAIRFLNANDTFTVNQIGVSLAYVTAFVLIGIVFTLLIIGGGIVVFFQLTQTNEWDEIRKNNVASSLISAAIIVGLSLIMDDYIGHLCEALIPYPEVMQIR